MNGNVNGRRLSGFADFLIFIAGLALVYSENIARCQGVSTTCCVVITKPNKMFVLFGIPVINHNQSGPQIKRVDTRDSQGWKVAL